MVVSGKPHTMIRRCRTLSRDAVLVFFHHRQSLSNVEWSVLITPWYTRLVIWRMQFDVWGFIVEENRHHILIPNKARNDVLVNQVDKLLLKSDQKLRLRSFQRVACRFKRAAIRYVDRRILLSHRVLRALVRSASMSRKKSAPIPLKQLQEVLS